MDVRTLNAVLYDFLAPLASLVRGGCGVLELFKGAECSVIELSIAVCSGIAGKEGTKFAAGVTGTKEVLEEGDSFGKKVSNDFMGSYDVTDVFFDRVVS